MWNVALLNLWLSCLQGSSLESCKERRSCDADVFLCFPGRTQSSAHHLLAPSPQQMVWPDARWATFKAQSCFWVSSPPFLLCLPRMTLLRCPLLARTAAVMQCLLFFFITRATWLLLWLFQPLPSRRAVCDPCSDSWDASCPATHSSAWQSTSGGPGPPAQSPSKLQLSVMLSSKMAGGLRQCSFRFAP